MNQSILASKHQTKIVRNNIEKVEEFYPKFIHDINRYTVRSAKLRDAGDKFARSLRDYADFEFPALKSGLKGVAECFATVQDHREALVSRLENKVAVPLTVYGTRCEQVRTEAQQPVVAQRIERVTHRSLVALQRCKAPPQHPRYVKAEAKYRRASDEVHRSRQVLREQVSDFQREKIRDLKQVFGEFLLSEMMFFSKSLELYTHAYQRLMDVDEEEVVEQLDGSMTEVPSSPKLPTGTDDQHGMEVDDDVVVDNVVVDNVVVDNVVVDNVGNSVQAEEAVVVAGESPLAPSLKRTH